MFPSSSAVRIRSEISAVHWTSFPIPSSADGAGILFALLLGLMYRYIFDNPYTRFYPGSFHLADFFIFFKILPHDRIRNPVFFPASSSTLSMNAWISP